MGKTEISIAPFHHTFLKEQSHHRHSCFGFGGHYIIAYSCRPHLRNKNVSREKKSYSWIITLPRVCALSAFVGIQTATRGDVMRGEVEPSSGG